MAASTDNRDLNETYVIYTLIRNGEMIVIENVPARVDPDTGEQFFSSLTVERLQSIAWSNHHPTRVIQTPVYEFTS